MRKSNIFIILVYTSSSLCFINPLISQSSDFDSTVYKITVDLEVRPRSEFTSNYNLPPNNSEPSFLYLTQRNRLSTLYERKKWLFKSDLQEIHYWTKFQTKSKVGGVNFFQLFLETKFKSIIIRVGRQGVILDNGRIFSEAQWAQQSRTHEGVRIIKVSTHLRNDLLFLLTRKYNNRFENAFSPVGSHRYKYLFVHHLNFNNQGVFSFNTINAIDVFETASSAKSFRRFTTGGRVEIKKSPCVATLNTYIQLGKNAQGKQVFAYYIQPEVRISYKSAIFEVGAEILSGSKQGIPLNNSGDFDVLYGVAWRFMGNMNVFTRFPNDVSGKD